MLRHSQQLSAYRALICEILIHHLIRTGLLEAPLTIVDNQTINFRNIVAQPFFIPANLVELSGPQPDCDVLDSAFPFELHPSRQLMVGDLIEGDVVEVIGTGSAICFDSMVELRFLADESAAPIVAHEYYLPCNGRQSCLFNRLCLQTPSPLRERAMRKSEQLFANALHIQN